MIEEQLNRRNQKLIECMIGAGTLKTSKVIEAFMKIPRHRFVTEEYRDSAYDDVALPTLKGSTISQPSTVAMMTEALEPQEGDTILEIGAGSGWQACVLASCIGETGKIIAIEIDESVTDFAKSNVSRFKFKNIEIVCGDGSVGYEAEAPFDKIIYTAAVPSVPEVVFKQLKIGGKIVAPIGDFFEQTLTIIHKVSEKKTREKYLGLFAFVPLRGKFGFQ